MKYIISIMNGYNRFFQSDFDHPFDMTDLLKKYVTYVAPNVRKKEVKGSTLYYEVMNAVNHAGISVNDIRFILSRGGPLGHQEKWLKGMIDRFYYDSTKLIMIGKSYGAIDTIKAIKKSKFTVDNLITIDSKGTMFGNKGATTKELGVTFIKIPNNVIKCHNVYQCHDIMQGYPALLRPNHSIYDRVVIEKDVRNKYYDKYSDGYTRELKLTHKNMEEIASTVKVFPEGTISDLIKVVL